MKTLSNKHFQLILAYVDQLNDFDLHSFSHQLSKFVRFDTVDNLIDYLVFEVNINCDSDLLKLSKREVRKIVVGMNKLIREDAKKLSNRRRTPVRNENKYDNDYDHYLMLKDEKRRSRVEKSKEKRERFNEFETKHNKLKVSWR